MKEVGGVTCDSGRAELAGPVLAITVLNDIKEKFGTVGSMVLWCDSAEVVGECEQKKLKLPPSRSCDRNVDLILEKETLKKDYGGTLKVKKVRAHQDNTCEYDELNFEARRNVDCDNAEKRALETASGADMLDELPSEWRQWSGQEREA